MKYIIILLLEKIKLKKLDIDYSNHLKLSNPLSGVHSIMRQSLVPNLILNIKNNQAKSNYLKIFEIGTVFYNNSGNFDSGESDNSNLPFQEKIISIVLSGNNNKEIFSEVKGVTESLIKNIANFSIGTVFIPNEGKNNWHGCYSVSVFVNNKKIGYISDLKNEVYNKFNIKKKTFVAELNFNEIYKLFLNYQEKNYKEPFKFPSVERDLSFVVNTELLYNDIKEEIQNFSELINDVKLFDIYQGDKLSENEKSLAFHISFVSSERTLEAKEVDKIINNLVERMEKKFFARLRNF